MDINVQEDLNAVNEQLAKMVEELNKITAARDQLLQQLQNMNGVAMYLRGKQPPEDQGQNKVVMADASEVTEVTEDVEGVTRTVEYPNS